MNRQSKILFFSTVVGFLFFYMVKVLWAYIPAINPITKSLFACCTSNFWFLPVIHTHDVLINILLCIPLAIFLVKLKPDNLWLAVIFALIPSFIYSSYYLFQPEYSGWNVSDFAFGWSVELLCLPIAVLLITFGAKREST